MNGLCKMIVLGFFLIVYSASIAYFDPRESDLVPGEMARIKKRPVIGKTVLKKTLPAEKKAGEAFNSYPSYA